MFYNKLLQKLGGLKYYFILSLFHMALRVTWARRFLLGISL
jgi:hypothetical protein